jgi:hypothetical protein
MGSDFRCCRISCLHLQQVNQHKRLNPQAETIGRKQSWHLANCCCFCGDAPAEKDGISDDAAESRPLNLATAAARIAGTREPATECGEVGGDGGGRV